MSVSSHVNSMDISSSPSISVYVGKVSGKGTRFFDKSGQYTTSIVSRSAISVIADPAVSDVGLNTSAPQALDYLLCI